MKATTEKRLIVGAVALTGAVLVAAGAMHGHLHHRLDALQVRSAAIQAQIEETQDKLAEAEDKLTEATLRAMEDVEPEPVETTAAPETAAVEPENLGTFKLTAYCPCAKCCGQWADGITYTGTVATAGRTVAVDPDVIPLGSTVRINGHDYIAEDIGGAIKESRIDVFFDSHQDALQFGVQYADVEIIKKGKET